MNIIDYIILIPLVYFTVKGVLRGFFKEVSSLVGIVLGVILGNVYQPELSKVLYNWFPDNKYIPLISLALIFTLIFIVCALAGWALRMLFKKASLGWFERLMGGVFAAAKIGFLSYVAIILLTFYVTATAPLISESVLAPWIIKSYQSVSGLVSPDHYENWKNKIIGKAKDLNKKVLDKVKNENSEK